MIAALVAMATVCVTDRLELPAARHGHRSHLIANKLFVFGGFVNHANDGGLGGRTGLVYDFKLGKWGDLPQMKTAKAFFSSVVIGGAIYAIGGTIERLAPGGGWETVSTDSRLPSTHFAAAAIGAKVYIVAGELFVFDTLTKKLTTGQAYPGMGPDDHFEIVAGLGDELHVIGGLVGDRLKPSKSHFVCRKGQWKRLADTPQAMFAKFAVTEIFDGNLLVFTSDFGYAFDPRTRKWQPLPKMPHGLVMPTAVVWKDRLHVLGGQPLDGRARAMSYDLKSKSWAVYER